MSDIVIVDDSVGTLKLLSEILARNRMRARAVRTASFALKTARDAVPDLFILDIRMPHINGYELCEQIKNDEKLRNVPVIFLSGMEDVSDKVRAFEVGAVDYIIKPFSEPELVSRIGVHIKTHTQHRALEDNRSKSEYILDNASFAIAVVNADFRITYFCKKFAKYLDVTEEIIENHKDYRDLVEYRVKRGDFGKGNSSAIAGDIIRKTFRSNSVNNFIERNARGRIFEYIVNKSEDFCYVITVIDKCRRDTANGDARIAAALRYIEDNIGEKLGNKILAAQVNMSESHFTRKFGKAMGKSPNRYVAERKMERATTLITRTDCSICEIAFLVGYDDLAYFCRRFKSIKGTTPGQLRKRNRCGAG